MLSKNGFTYSEILAYYAINILIFVPVIIVQTIPVTSPWTPTQSEANQNFYDSGFPSSQTQNHNQPSYDYDYNYNWFAGNNTTGNFYYENQNQPIHNITHSNLKSVDSIQKTFHFVPEDVVGAGYKDNHDHRYGYDLPQPEYLHFHQETHESESESESESKKKRSGIKSIKKLKKTVSATKAIKIGTAVIIVQLFLVVIALGLLSRSGGRLAPIAFPLALLPIGLIAAIPAIPLFIGTLSSIAVHNKIGSSGRRRSRRTMSRHSRSVNPIDYNNDLAIRIINEAELLFRIFEF